MPRPEQQPAQQDLRFTGRPLDVDLHDYAYYLTKDEERHAIETRIKEKTEQHQPLSAQEEKFVAEKADYWRGDDQPDYSGYTRGKSRH